MWWEITLGDSFSSSAWCSFAGEVSSAYSHQCALILFGAKYPTTNTSMLYTAKGAAAFLVPLGAVAAKATENWNDVPFLATGINVITVIIVLVFLRPAANRHHLDGKNSQRHDAVLTSHAPVNAAA
jgi:OFA family oxalate/formate antiporter-like MFS transporter